MCPRLEVSSSWPRAWAGATRTHSSCDMGRVLRDGAQSRGDFIKQSERRAGAGRGAAGSGRGGRRPTRCLLSDVGAGGCLETPCSGAKQLGQRGDTISPAMLLINTYISMYSCWLWYWIIFDIEYISIHRLFLIPEDRSNLNLTEMQEANASSLGVHDPLGKGVSSFSGLPFTSHSKPRSRLSGHCPRATSAQLRCPIRFSLSHFMPLKTRTPPALPKAPAPSGSCMEQTIRKVGGQLGRGAAQRAGKC